MGLRDALTRRRRRPRNCRPRTQELEACTSKIATKMNRDERSAAALATARAGLRCAAALEGDQLDAGPCALLEAAVVRAAASGVRGAPSREKLAGRFKHRVEGPARAWLLVPDHADGVLGHAFAAVAAWLGARGGVGGAGDDRRQARDELDAGARCLEVGDLNGDAPAPEGGAIRPARVHRVSFRYVRLADAEARLADQAASVTAGGRGVAGAGGGGGGVRRGVTARWLPSSADLPPACCWYSAD